MESENYVTRRQSLKLLGMFFVSPLFCEKQPGSLIPRHLFPSLFLSLSLFPGELLLDRTNFTVMTRYISNPENLKLMMNLLRDKSRNIQFEAFHVFKVFVANPNKSEPIQDILLKNKDKVWAAVEGKRGLRSLEAPVPLTQARLRIFPSPFSPTAHQVLGKLPH